MSSPPTQLVIITGLAGSGKSSVVKCFEDLGYYSVDNLPLPLLRQFIAAPSELAGGAQRIAVVCDLRTPSFVEELPRLLTDTTTEHSRSAAEVTVLFLEASTEVILRRFSETRRPHPMSRDGRVPDGIERERKLLSEIRGLADVVFDTSDWSNIHEVRAEVFRRFGDERGQPHSMAVSVISFGFKYGIPYGSDSVFDVRFLPNPHFEPGLRELTGRDAAVLEFLGSQPEFLEINDRLEALWRYLLPQYGTENRSHLSIAVGCTGGKHRSVAVVEELAKRLAEAGWSPSMLHRDIDR